MRGLVLLALSVALAWLYKALQPPPPTVCGTPFGPPVTASRVRLHDGRFLAYKESGVLKEKANYKIINVHGFRGTRNDIIPVSKGVIEELGIYFVGFDRAGYGQSDPDPARTVKSAAFDIQELADILELGPKFYVVSISIGGYSAWSTIKYIPHRLAGVAMLCPVGNYWWAGLPFKEAFKAFRLQPVQDQVAVSVAHYAPWLTYLWNTQKWFPSSSAASGKMYFLNDMDKDIMKKTIARLQSGGGSLDESIQQGVYESLFCDMNNMFGSWEFDPGDLKNPFSNGEGSVHIWHGDEDFLVPMMLQKYVHRRLPWVHLHELPGYGHSLPAVNGLPDRVVRALLVNES